MATATVKLRAHFAWWWSIHRVYFSLLILAVRLGLLKGERAYRWAQAFASAAVSVGVGDRPRPIRRLGKSGPLIIAPFGWRFLAFTLYGWGCDLYLWRRAGYLVVTWGCEGKRLYLSRNATPWAAYWGIGWFDGRFTWRHRGERCDVQST
jgi:hypothetical protein